jgi:hypothetical protein
MEHNIIPADLAFQPVPGPEGLSARPNILVISDTWEAGNLAQNALEAAGGRMAGHVDISQAAQRLDDQISLDAVMVECARTSPTIVNPLLDRISGLAGQRPPIALVSTSLDQIDAFSGWLDDDAVTLLCTPNLVDRVVALQLAMTTETGLLRDGATDIESMRLRRIADEVGRIAKALANLSEPHPPRGLAPGVQDMMMGFRAEPQHTDFAQGPSSSELRATIRARRAREQFFDSDLFADPAWDMLLDLMAARLETVQVAVSSLCIAAAVPPTTALRWIKRMTDEGIFERVADPDDGRRIFIRLSDHANEKMIRYWTVARRATNAIV